MTEPQRLCDLLPPVVAHLAVLCADPMPLDPAVLCRRLRGHLGVHASDGADHWNTDPNPRSDP